MAGDVQAQAKQLAQGVIDRADDYEDMVDYILEVSEDPKTLPPIKEAADVWFMTAVERGEGEVLRMARNTLNK